MRSIAVLAIALLAPFAAQGEEGVPDVVREVAAKLAPGHQPDSIEKASLPGFYTVAFGSQYVYVSKNGRYLLDGEVIDLERGVNLTEAQRSEGRQAELETIDESSMIVYEPEQKATHTVTVFTDVDCPYCRKLHEHMDEMNGLGVRVRYMAYPRAGVDSPTYRKMESVWCSDDRKAAMDAVKAQKGIPASSCQNPIEQHMAVATRLGVRGTPAVVLDDGRMIPGYVPPARLKKMLEE